MPLIRHGNEHFRQRHEFVEALTHETHETAFLVVNSAGNLLRWPPIIASTLYFRERVSSHAAARQVAGMTGGGVP